MRPALKFDRDHPHPDTIIHPDVEFAFARLDLDRADLALFKRGRPLRVVVMLDPEMSATVDVDMLVPFVDELKPRRIAMCGFDAGRRGKVVAADLPLARQLVATATLRGAWTTWASG